MILSISDIKRSKKEIEKIVFLYLAGTVFCAVFGAVYECFSHEVFSYYMLYAFGIPLLGGAMPLYSVQYFQRKIPGSRARLFQYFGIATLTVGCIFQGALEIYGTTNRLTVLYMIVGSAFLFIGGLMYLLQKN